MSLAPTLFVIGLVLGLLVLLGLLGEYKFVALKPYMRSEGFDARGRDDGWMPTASGRNPEGVPTGYDESLQGASLKAEANEKLLTSDRLVPQTTEEANDNWSKFTSEKCFRADMGEVLKKTRNFLQRTNNYPRSHPDSCSAPNHEFVGTFYRPHEGVGATPATGLPLPAGKA